MGQDTPITKTPQNETQSKNLLKKILVNFLKFGLGAIVVYIIIQKVDLSKVQFYMAQANWMYLILAFLSFFISKFFASLRINTYYRTIGLSISELLNFKLNLFSMFYNLFLPLIGGEGYRIYWIKKRYQTPVKKLIWASLLDRVSGLALLVALAIVLLQFTAVEFYMKSVTIFLIPMLFGVYFGIHYFFFKIYQSAWVMANIYSFIIQCLQVITAFFILKALHIEESTMDYLFVFLISCLAYVLPFIGAREMAFVFGANVLGLDMELSLAISLFFYLSIAISSISGIYFLFFPEKLTD